MGNEKRPRSVGRSSSRSGGTWPRKTSISVPWLMAEAMASTSTSCGASPGSGSPRSSTARGSGNQTAVEDDVIIQDRETLAGKAQCLRELVHAQVADGIGAAANDARGDADDQALHEFLP